MVNARVIPCLQLINDSLVKTVKFDKYSYIGDPINTVRIFNELEVDELCFLDIRATSQNREPDVKLLKSIADECFMPLSYGGGLKSFEICKRILSIGFEKVVINSQAYHQPGFIKQVSEHFGSQSVIGSIDAKKNIWGKYQVFVNNGKEKIAIDVVEWAQQMVAQGVGELLITSMDRDGTWEGYDTTLIKKITSVVDVPVIASGGAGSIAHMKDAIKIGNASALALGSMVVYQKKNMGVLVNFPDKKELSAIFE
jgi:imidazole glycerol-phosphate synthase subunit HisF